MLTAQDMSYDEARNLHSKWQKHQAFMAELASNKDWLDKIDKVSIIYFMHTNDIFFQLYPWLSFSTISKKNYIIRKCLELFFPLFNRRVRHLLQRSPS